MVQLIGHDDLSIVYFSHNINSVSPLLTICNLYCGLFIGGRGGGPPQINKTDTVTIYDPSELGCYSKSASVNNLTTSR